ncbi:MAG: 4Fe-4S binding protein [Bacteroidota bacterium]|jgi:polyferredoxin
MSQQISLDYRRHAAEDVLDRTVPNIRKLSPDLRRPRTIPPKQLSQYQRFLWKLKHDSQVLRSTVQLSFVLLCIWIGIEFYLFMQWGLSGGSTSLSSRPPGAEGFLPISALMSLKYWLDTGIVNQIHPSGFFIFLAIAAVSLVLKKAFCSWLCPIGTLSESLWMLGERLFGRNPRITKWLDTPLRSLKYLLLFFFAFAIWRMDVPSMKAFIESPYNRMADVKMYLFFAHITSTALWTILILMVFSIVVKNFWCRYLCPYGALLGFFSILSPIKITRQKSMCIDCELCTKACPAGIKVHIAGRVWSDECTACMKCVEDCPVKNTLDLRTPHGSKAVPSWVFGCLVGGVFGAITGLAMLSGSWQNNITKEEYQTRFQQLESPAYSHPFSGTGNYGPN